MITNDSSRVLTVKELSDYLKVHPSTIYRQLKRGRLPAFKVGSDWRFNIESIGGAWSKIPSSRCNHVHSEVPVRARVVGEEGSHVRRAPARAPGVAKRR